MFSISLPLFSHCFVLFSVQITQQQQQQQHHTPNLVQKAKPTALYKAHCTVRSYIHCHYQHQAGDAVISITAAKDLGRAS